MTDQGSLHAQDEFLPKPELQGVMIDPEDPLQEAALNPEKASEASPYSPWSDVAPGKQEKQRKEHDNGDDSDSWEQV